VRGSLVEKLVMTRFVQSAPAARGIVYDFRGPLTHGHPATGEICTCKQDYPPEHFHRRMAQMVKRPAEAQRPLAG